MSVEKTATIWTYIGLSSDTKPSGAPVGSTFFETDTSRQSVYDGTNWWLTQAMAQGYSVIKVVEIAQGTTSYSYTTGARALMVEGIGGGGAGGSVATAATNSGAAGGGGAGAYSFVFLSGLPANPITVQVGAGGTPGSAGANPGGNGTDTQFGTAGLYLIAKGGTGGAADTVAAGPRVGGMGGAGGASGSGVGDAKFDGAVGEAGVALAAAQALSGAGGVGPYGGSGAQQNTQHAGATGGNYGSGGSGGCILSGGASVAGGAGANGLLRIYELA